MDNLMQKLLSKSEEAFIMAVEIYNKPTIRYRVEGFAFFICNAWELALKARLIDTKGPDSIYFKDKPGRTLSLERCVQLVFTNNKDPLRINLERIIELRNTSTHFITEEYEQIYVPLFQSCVMNYTNKMLDFFGLDITEKIASNFLTLSVRLSNIEENEIRARYPKQMAERILKAKQDVEQSIPENGSDKYAVTIRHNIYITKKPTEATLPISLTKDASQAAFIMKDVRDMQNTCPYQRKRCIEKINARIKQQNIPFINPSKVDDPEKRNRFNSYHFQLFIDFYDIKSNKKYCYAYHVNQQTLYSYSQAAIEFILGEIKKDPERIVQNLRQALGKN